MSQQLEDAQVVGSSKKRQRETISRPHSAGRKSRKLNDEGSPASESERDQDDISKPQNKHSKKERKQNRSTRIHSLRKLLARGTLPSTVQQEKERELAALLHEQNKTTSRKQAKKTLEKYHYVRFMERRKAEKRLKQLYKQQEGQAQDADLTERIHEMEVNRNYAIYAPLGKKYVSIFVAGAGESAGTNDTGEPAIRSIAKPATWHAVEAAMLKGDAALEAIRDGETASAPGDPNKDESVQRQDKESSRQRQTKHPISKLPRDKSHDAGKNSLRAERDPGASSDSDQSDGGFFERPIND